MVTTIAKQLEQLEKLEQRAEQALDGQTVTDNRASTEMLSAYNELDVRSDFRADVLVQLKANMAELEDLHSRLRYMMGEISYLMKKY